MVIGSFAYILFVLFSALPAWRLDNPNPDSFLQNLAFIKFLLVVAVVINGLGCTLLWVGQGDYFSHCATPENKGTYFGVFWSFY